MNKRERQRLWKGWEDRSYTMEERRAIAAFVRTGEVTNHYQWMAEHGQIPEMTE